MAIISYASGIDYFTREPGTTDSLACLACKTELKIRRNVSMGRRGPMGLHSPTTRTLDEFICENSGEDWHRQAVALVQFVHSTPSAALAQIVEAEIAQIVKDKSPTKESWH